jgi:signal transduction histidine kinase
LLQSILSLCANRVQGATKPDGGRLTPVFTRWLPRLSHGGPPVIVGWMDAPQAKILVVDDIPENVRLLEAVLAPRGYQVIPASSGEEALRLVEEHDPDLVLLDVVMPGMDGYAVCRSIRANDQTALLPVIMVTSSIGPEKTEAIEAGADDFIPKPFNHGELLTRVKSLLRIKRYQDTIKELNRTLEQRVQSQVEALELQADELRASRARIVAAADSERRRIERDLHDGAQQYLVGLAANLRAAQDLIASDPAKAQTIMEELSGTVGQAMQEFRDLSHGIYPPLLQDRGLAEALANAARGLPIPAKVDSDGLGRYEPPIEAAVYFCCVEALQNAAKHGGENASVRLWTEDGEIRFEVADDGPGIDQGRAAGGIGLINMRDRMGAIGGSVEIDSIPSGGTAVRGAVPAQPSAR